MVGSVFEAVFEYAKTRPDKLCLADRTGGVTYAGYAERIARIASFFAAKGIGRGSRVVLEAAQTIDYLACQLALQGLGAVFIPLERKCAPDKMRRVLDYCGADAFLSRKSVPDAGTLSLTMDELSAGAAGCEPYHFEKMPAADDVCEILLSTGTTGREKGIMITNANNVALAENVIHGVEMQPDNVEMIPSPLNHSHGLRRYYANMVMGASCVVVSGVMNLPGMYELMDRYGVNSMDLVPAALSVILRLSSERLGEYAGRLRYIQLGSAPLMQSDKEKLMELLPNTRLYNFYGSTESGCICIYDFNDGRDKKNCIGKPAHNAHIVIVDEDRNVIESSPEHTGRLAAAGAMNSPGYYNDPGETAKVFGGGFLYTNDEAYFDEDGDVILLGRIGDVINVGGAKVSPEEVEDIAGAIPGVEDCCCVPCKDDMMGQVPKLFVKMAPGCAFDPAAIKTAIAAKAEPYKVPKIIVETDDIPRTFNGKLLRRLLS